MFQAVRNFAGLTSGFFKKQRFRRTARLFLFEFTVVLLGVLAAQLLQEAMTKRRERSDARSAVAQLKRDVAVMSAIASFWDRSSKCLVDHVTIVARAAAEGGTLTSHEIGRPALPTPEYSEWTETVMDAVERNFGTAPVRAHVALAQDTDIIDGYNRQIAADWAAFALLDPAVGRASAEDRANVRLAAIRVRTQLKMFSVKAQEIRRVAKALGIHDDPRATEEYRSVADSCGLLRNW